MTSHSPASRSREADTTSSIFPLSYAQERLWLITRLYPGQAAHNIGAAFRIIGTLDKSALARSVDEIVRRHESLRTRFRESAGVPVQVIVPHQTGSLVSCDLSSSAEPEPELRRVVEMGVTRPFDLARDSLFRATLFQVAVNEHVLLIVLHHIITDGWSTEVFSQELRVLYEAFLHGRPSPLSDLPLQYVDYAMWQRQALQSKRLDALLEHWRDRLRGAPPELTLPVDHPRPPLQSFRGSDLSVTFEPRLADALRVLSRREGATLFMTLAAAWAILLGRQAAQEDVLVGFPNAGRNRKELEALIGFFANMLVLRVDLSGDPTFREVLARVRDAALDAYENQDAPFGHVVEAVAQSRSANRPPLIQVMFAWQNAPRSTLGLAGVVLRPEPLRHTTAQFDLSLALGEIDGCIGGVLEYCTDLFEAASISNMAVQLTVLLKEIVADPGRRLSALSSLSPEERVHLVSPRHTGYEPDTVPRVLEAQVRRTPEATALIGEGREWTYAELDRWANRVAHAVRRQGIGPEDLVAVLFPRSPTLIAAVLGILKAGAAFLPLDPASPLERQALVLGEAGVRLVLTTAAHVQGLGGHGGPFALIDVAEGGLRDQDDSPLEVATDAAHLAYVIFTSGSTGRPKGVMVPHGGVTNLMEAQARAFAVVPGARVLQFASPGFDAFVSEVFVTLGSGATLCLPSPGVPLVGEVLRDTLIRLRITHVTLPLSAVSTLDPASYGPMLDTLVVAGEQLPGASVTAWVGRVHRLLNAYGPTEATVCATISPPLGLEEGTRASASIGRPLANTGAYVLDAYMELVPPGVIGELYIGGIGVGRGYWNRPGLTAERFVPDPLGGDLGTRLYRTGDRVRWRSDRQLEFVGRTDRQVKIRGHRVEPGEIEAVLRAHPDVRDATVAMRERGRGGAALVAYVTGEAATLSTHELRSSLEARLPAYMIPSAIVVMEAFPFIASGKIDLSALPQPDGDVDSLEPELESRSPLELLIVQVWSELLGLDRIGLHDSFFSLGGNSLLLVRVHAKLTEALGYSISLIELFRYPTVAKMALGIRPTVSPVSLKGSIDRAMARRLSMSENVARKRVHGEFPKTTPRSPPAIEEEEGSST